MIKPLIGVILTALPSLDGMPEIRSISRRRELPLGPDHDDRGANPGGGFDITIRSVVDALQKEHIVDVPLPIENRPGASGADFLATMVEQYRGDDDQISVTSLSMMMNELRGVSKYGYDDVTMIARLMTEYFVVVTRADSPFKNLGDVMTAIKSDPARVAVGAAQDDEAPFDLLVSAAGGDPSSINYARLEGGGDQILALRDGKISVAVGGVSEFIGSLKSGELRALGVLAENRLPGLDAPTAREQGLDVTLAELARPLRSAGYAGVRRCVLAEGARSNGAVTHLAGRSQSGRQFTTTFMTDEELQTFLADTQADVKAALG